MVSEISDGSITKWSSTHTKLDKAAWLVVQRGKLLQTRPIVRFETCVSHFPRIYIERITIDIKTFFKEIMGDLLQVHI